MSSSKEATVINKSDVINLIARYMTKAFFGLIGLSVYIIIQIIRYSPSNRYYLLLSGAILSLIAIAGYAISLAKNADKKTERSLNQSLIIFGGFIPYIYGSYLVFYEGFWRLRHLADGLSFSVIFYSLVFVLIGYSVVSAIYQISEFDRAVSEENIIIKENDA